MPRSSVVRRRVVLQYTTAPTATAAAGVAPGLQNRSGVCATHRELFGGHIMIAGSNRLEEFLRRAAGLDIERTC
jgi:hypothetical protein